MRVCCGILSCSLSCFRFFTVRIARATVIDSFAAQVLAGNRKALNVLAWFWNPFSQLWQTEIASAIEHLHSLCASLSQHHQSEPPARSVQDVVEFVEGSAAMQACLFRFLHCSVLIAELSVAKFQVSCLLQLAKNRAFAGEVCRLLLFAVEKRNEFDAAFIVNCFPIIREICSADADYPMIKKRFSNLANTR